MDAIRLGLIVWPRWLLPGIVGAVCGTLLTLGLGQATGEVRIGHHETPAVVSSYQLPSAPPGKDLIVPTVNLDGDVATAAATGWESVSAPPGKDLNPPEVNLGDSASGQPAVVQPVCPSIYLALCATPGRAGAPTDQLWVDDENMIRHDPPLPNSQP